jgi:DNA-3-methyladenine glycosylase I
MPFNAITPTSLADYFEMMSQAVFKAGISWQVIEAKWPGIREAFEGFDPEKVAAYTPEDVERLMSDAHVVRNLRKIEGTIDNAGELLNVDREFGGFERYLESFDDNDDLVRDLHKRFKFLGDSTAHIFLYTVSFNPEAQHHWAEEHFAGAAHRPGARH